MSTGLKKKLNKKAMSFEPAKEDQEKLPQGGEFHPEGESFAYQFINDFERL